MWNQRIIPDINKGFVENNVIIYKIRFNTRNEWKTRKILGFGNRTCIIIKFTHCFVILKVLYYNKSRT